MCNFARRVSDSWARFEVGDATAIPCVSGFMMPRFPACGCTGLVDIEIRPRQHFSPLSARTCRDLVQNSVGLDAIHVRAPELSTTFDNSEDFWTQLHRRRDPTPEYATSSSEGAR